jgi:hypothetical protein
MLSLAEFIASIYCISSKLETIKESKKVSKTRSRSKKNTKRKKKKKD